MKKHFISLLLIICSTFISCSYPADTSKYVYNDTFYLNTYLFYTDFLEAYNNHFSSPYSVDSSYDYDGLEVEVHYVEPTNLELQIQHDETYIHEISLSFFEDTLSDTYIFLEDFFPVIGLPYNIKDLERIIEELDDTEFVEFDHMWFFIHKYESYKEELHDIAPCYWLKISFD